MTPVFSLNDFHSGPQLSSSLGDRLAIKRGISSPSYEGPDLTLGETRGVPVPSRMVFRIWKDCRLSAYKAPSFTVSPRRAERCPPSLKRCEHSHPVCSRMRVESEGTGVPLRPGGMVPDHLSFLLIPLYLCRYVWLGWVSSQDLPCPPLSLSAVSTCCARKTSLGAQEPTG